MAATGVPEAYAPKSGALPTTAKTASSATEMNAEKYAAAVQRAKRGDWGCGCTGSTCIDCFSYKISIWKDIKCNHVTNCTTMEVCKNAQGEESTDCANRYQAVP
ncbi:hypothetical protein PRIPAC_81616 [Pristionchus pacificus]|uniref:Uncharacterized protein n=1 Tax=Pristionchus pacificus TaxID=54126 RepID=A0A2A6BXF0_PRIPA|nr:hypothetical protein PRIPAC_81616 [Pristionchus pacificus]|eukprot:PDM70575.1 hypothetical protein PRIPAC_46821 [Pristionchus pacificus]